MKRLLHIALILLLVVQCYAIEHQYAPHSVLSSGNWIKIRIAESGIYCLPYDTLLSWGLNPEKVSIHGFGGAMLSQDFNQTKIDDLPAVGFYMEKGADGVFGQGDYILFYAQGTISWKYNPSETGQNFSHTINPYSNYGYYFLSDNAGTQKSITGQTLSNINADKVINTYNYRDVYEVDSINLLDAGKGVDGGGREWYSQAFPSSNPQRSISFNVPNILTTENVCFRAGVASYSSKQSQFVVSSNNKSASIPLPGIQSSDFYTKATDGIITLTTNAQATSKQTATLQYKPQDKTSSGYMNYIEIEAKCRLAMDGQSLRFRTVEGYHMSTSLRYEIAGATANTQVWDITDLSNIYAVDTHYENGTLSFVANNTDRIHEYYAVQPKNNGWKKPVRIGSLHNQNLHHLSNIDLVIISPEAFVEASTRLAKQHEEQDHITWAVVTDQEVYNEFSSGTPDASAYRWMMKTLYDKASNSTERPKWLLLMGDGTFDNRKLLPTSGPNTLLTYQTANSTVETKALATDDYFGWLLNKDGLSDENATMQIGVGRLPVSTLEEANKMVDKIIRYMTNDNFGTWKQQILFLADDGDNGMHTETAEAGAERVRTNNPNLIVNKVYLDAYPQEVNAAGETYPLAKNRVDNLLRNGVLYMNYSGHGGYNNITNEGMMSLHDVQRMNNQNMAFWMYATCSFAHFDSGKRSTAEEAVLNPNGGAIGVLSADRTVYAHQNTILNRNLCDSLFKHKNDFNYGETLGDACRKAKNATGSDANKLAYILLADPALHLKFPTELQVKTSTQLDTINALTAHEVKGYIEQEDADTAKWFNGKVHFTIYDKMQIITTRDNDEKDPEKQKLLSYKDYPNTIFSGETEVKDGLFQYVFMTPKDIRYNYGNGRIVYYAYDAENHAEGVGHYEDFVVGGSPKSIIEDTVGPNVTIYLNNPSFQDGMITYETPRFFAEIEDQNGINTAGSGIGHDLTLIIDDDPKQSYILNSYFQAESNSYQKGRISYLLPELANGRHNLTFRAWDLLNNSTTKSLYFDVVKGTRPTIFQVDVYPNPVQENSTLHLSVQYDQPDLPMSLHTYIYNAQGQLVYQYNQNNSTEVIINMTQLGLSAGVYIYRTEIHSETNGTTSSAGKIIVTK